MNALCFRRAVVMIIVLLLSSGKSFAIDITPTGFYYPTGTSDLGPYAWWMASGCGEDTDYFPGYYHIGHDFQTDINDPVYLISNGIVEYISYNGWGENNEGILVRHQLFDGSYFLALYGHIQSTVSVGDPVFAGDILGTIGPWDTGIHLHFGVLPGVNYPPSNWGMMNCVNWPSTNGFVDPINWIINQAPMPTSEVGYFADGWHDDGISQAFLDKYNELASQGHNLGDPWDNGPGDQWVHEQNNMYIQDFLGYSNGYNLPYTALIRKVGDGESVNLLKDAFWDLWINHAGWENFGAPTSDEYPIGGNVRQDFNDDTTYYYFFWNGSVAEARYAATGQPVDLANITVENGAGPREESDGVYQGVRRVADFGQPFQLINDRSYSGFFAIIDGQEEEISPFTVNGDMTIYVDGVTSEVIDLSLSPETPQPGEYFQVWVLGTGSPGIVVDGFRVVLLTLADVVLDTIYSASDVDISYGFDGVYTAQYETAGIYKIGVQYSLDEGSTWTYFDSDAETENPIIFDIMSPPPVASFTYDPASGYVPLLVWFFDQSTNNPTEWLWNFGDGETSVFQNPSHIYEEAGTYTVTLTVTNSAGEDTEICFDCIAVSDGGEVIANFTAYPLSGTVPHTVQFNNMSIGDDIDYVYYQFGDGETSTEEDPIHTYTTAGSFTVSLLVSSPYHSDYLERPNYITVEDPGGCIGYGAYRFNGIDQYLTVGVLVGGVLGNETSVEAWVRLDRNNVEQNIYSYWNVAQHKMFNLYVDSAGRFVGERYGVTPSSAVGSTILTVDEWHYVAMVSQQGQPTKVYVDGALDGVSSDILDTPNITSALLGTMAVQNYDGTHINYLEGAIDEVRVSTVARTAVEIADHYASRSEHVVDAGTITLWHMNGEAGTPEKMADAETSVPRDLSERNVPQATSGFNECLPDPIVLTIAYINEEIVLDWNDIPEAIFYNVYGSNDGGPYSVVAITTASDYIVPEAMFNSGNVWLFYVTVIY